MRRVSVILILAAVVVGGIGYFTHDLDSGPEPLPSIDSARIARLRLLEATIYKVGVSSGDPPESLASLIGAIDPEKLSEARETFKELSNLGAGQGLGGDLRMVRSGAAVYIAETGAGRDYFASHGSRLKDRHLVLTPEEGIQFMKHKEFEAFIAKNEPGTTEQNKPLRRTDK